ncbi:MAG TPA: DUF4870 domain-containing protein [Clostridia bacterium]|nr:DUF4870 domain-containing protein [Clostridia bacterium]
MKNQVYELHKSSIGDMNANIMAMLTYVASVVVSWIPVIRYFAWLVPLVLFFMEKQSKFVKFHAMQSFVLNLACAALTFLISVIIGGIVSASVVNIYAAYSALGLLGFIGFLTMAVCLVITVFAIIAMVKAYGFKEYHIPLAGGIAEKTGGEF